MPQFSDEVRKHEDNNLSAVANVSSVLPNYFAIVTFKKFYHQHDKRETEIVELKCDQESSADYIMKTEAQAPARAVLAINKLITSCLLFPTTTTQNATLSSDPFASQRESNGTAFDTNNEITAAGGKTEPLNMTPKKSHEETDEWDASKTPPSRFQQRKGSIYATPGSRDGHVDRNYDRDAKYHEKLAEKGWGSKFRRGSKSSN
ncbi:hypothetical protein G7Y89_g10425 [Cudoniella acicularis]|uniref:Uncharacterized protein n=1 Tax=Cudoniella acicularis TaxID=354080 RepID=A0A8H4RF49_9HELO|nr:hypothetical protein G7Y89_g10425 [Cudoniella acicularis]